MASNILIDLSEFLKETDILKILLPIIVEYIRYTFKTNEELKQAGFKICLVSPELQKHPLDRISEFKEQTIGMDIDAVCTKRPDLWK